MLATLDDAGDVMGAWVEHREGFTTWQRLDDYGTNADDALVAWVENLIGRGRALVNGVDWPEPWYGASPTASATAQAPRRSATA